MRRTMEADIVGEVLKVWVQWIEVFTYCDL
jgi:hypothetical protein